MAIILIIKARGQLRVKGHKFLVSPLDTMAYQLVYSKMEPTIVVCIGQYYCSLCHLKFPFKSKLDRHLISENHLVFANCMQTMQGGIGADDEPSVAEEVWCICSLAICMYNKLVMFQSLMMPVWRRRVCLGPKKSGLLIQVVS